MEQNEIMPGTVVALKSGGPLMTVACVEGRQVHCVWFDKLKLKTGTFHPESLASLENDE